MDTKAETAETAETADGSHEGRRGRFVLLPMLRSVALAVLAVAFATVSAVGLAMPNADAEPDARTRSSLTAERVDKATVGTKEARQIEKPTSPEAADGNSEAAETDEGAKSEPEVGSSEKSSEEAAGESKAAPEAISGSSPSGSGESRAGSGGGTAEGAEATDGGHRHNWVQETKTVDHPAEYKDVQHEATYQKKKWTKCNACGDDITGKVAEHISGHAAAGEPASYHTEESRVCVKEAWTEYGVLAKEAWSEEVPTGVEVCSTCGARR